MKSHVSSPHCVLIPLNQVDSFFDSLTELWNSFASEEDFKGFLIKHYGNSSDNGKISVCPVFSSSSSVSYSDVELLFKQ